MDRISIQLKLKPRSAWPNISDREHWDDAEFWVIQDNSPERIVQEFIDSSDDQLINSFLLAFGKFQNQKIAILKVKNRKSVPILVLPKITAYRSLLHLENFLVPIDRDLNPPLRRDIVRKILATNPELIYWLAPIGEKGFSLQSIPKLAFKPIMEFAEYVVPTQEPETGVWEQSERWSFASFGVKDEAIPVDSPKLKPKEKVEQQWPEEEEIKKKDNKIQKKDKAQTPKDKAQTPKEEFTLLEAKPDELQKQLVVLQDKFLSIQGDLDSPERLTLWPQLAAVNAGLKRPADAAVCWLNALWAKNNREYACEWKKSEGPADFYLTDPTEADVRSVVVCFLNGSFQDLLPKVQEYLLRNESRMSIRTAWLAWLHFALLTGNDVLVLAKARDRLLDRMLNHGVVPQQEIPNFLRFGSGSERFLLVRNQVAELAEISNKWISDGYADPSVMPKTRAYKDLMFAFALARLGDKDRSQNLLREATRVLNKGDAVHKLLLAAYSYRIVQAIEGKSHGQLPPEVLGKINEMDEAATKLKPEDPMRIHAFLVARMRKHSRILEPQERVDAFRCWKTPSDDLTKELAKFHLQENDKVEKEMAKLFKEHKKPKEQFILLAAAFELAPRLGGPFTINVLERLCGVLNEDLTGSIHETTHRIELLERALFFAAHYDKANAVKRIVAVFVKLLEMHWNELQSKNLAKLAAQSLRGLRKLGMRAEVENLLRRMNSFTVKNGDLQEAKQKSGDNWVHSLQTLLHLAAGWLYFGKMEQAQPVLNEARIMLFDSQISQIVFKANLACAYCGAIGQAPVDVALKGFAELFTRLGPLNDSFTTNSHYSLSQLQVIEAVVLELVSDDFAVDQNVRRWLDEDEYLIRCKIHTDMRKALET
jgi:hypothetical protein